MRAVSEDFLHDLKDGILRHLTERVRVDDTLMLALRGTSINIYYRGGNIMRIAKNHSGYRATFDENYAGKNAFPEHLALLEQLPKSIGAEADCQLWLKSFPHLKEIMNGHRAKYPKLEREFQQLVAWENNRSRNANGTEYFITDIEYDGGAGSGRFDMVGLRWLAKDKKTGRKCGPVFIEMKYGDTALDGKSGLKKHLNDLSKALHDEEKRKNLNNMIENQFRQLDQLGLLRFNRARTFDGVTVSGKPEVVIILGNTNPNSVILRRLIGSIEEPVDFELRFFVARFAGYALHSKCVVGLREFQALLDSGELQ
ncbi:hypothetical protein LB515_02380 [Mesorhizobium sp. CA15]|uniref:hypothetical protein n=1 Tax=Mesorhizobium sp. CA15 TaxID=2876641 RepID=UPI001CD13D53|nr:hypothetical protein [Mesorhizobium sp. CA15]MBZ9864213.1 hypothetical protein [Mesorhizobium sp. CA15]